MTSNHQRVARVVNKLFDVLTDVEVEIAHAALVQVTEEFRRAQDEDELPSRFREKGE